jgi:hypothetical protein
MKAGDKESELQDFIADDKILSPRSGIITPNYW